jgi:hypothetical protein
MRYLSKSVLSGAVVTAICVTLWLTWPATALAQQTTSAGIGALVVPTWDASIVQTRGSTCGYCNMTDQTRANALGIGLLSSPVTEATPAAYFVNSGSAGTARQYQVGGGAMATRDIDGQMSFSVAEGSPPLAPDTTSRIPNETQALALAQAIASRLGLPAGEIAGSQTHGLAISGWTTLGPTAPTTIGRAVEFHRSVGGYRVLGSQARFEFGRDGVLKSALIHWPQFRLKPGITKVRDRSAVLAEVTPKTNGRVVYELEVVFAQGADGSMAPMMLAVTAPLGGVAVSRDLVPLTE